MDHIHFGKKRIQYTVRKGKREKTLAIAVTPATQVIVLAPEDFNTEKIKSVVRKKAKWILEKQEHFQKKALLFPEKEFISGEQIILMGRRYRLKIHEREDAEPCVPKVDGRRIHISVQRNLIPDERMAIIKEALIQWYCLHAKRIIHKRAERYGKICGIYPREIIIKDQKTRWGSCSKDGVLRFNWRIVVAPVSIIDYVVVHEMCHMKIKNHSPEFWRLVSLAIPDYKKRRNWLRENSRIMRF